MRKLDQRGVAAFEFCMLAVPLFTLMFVIIDLGRYAITMQSLRALANAGARAAMIQCYTPAVIGTSANTSPSACTGDYLTLAEKQAIAPFLYAGGLSPTVATTVVGSTLTVKATLLGFDSIVPLWGTTFKNPSASTAIPF
ncbi:TadE/TadG family type IV pilus assembly protein [Bradyrhizobium sp. USDA 4502]